MLLLVSGPGIYALLSLWQPSKLMVLAVVFGLPMALIVTRGLIAFFRLLSPTCHRSRPWSPPGRIQIH